MMTRGEAKDDLENIVKEMRMEMNERFALNEEKLLELKTENLQLNEDLVNTYEDLTNTKEDLANTKEDLTKAKEELTNSKEDLTNTKEDLTNTNEDLTNTKEDLLDTKIDVSFLKEPPFFHACGYQSSTSITEQTIPYSSLLYFSSNTEGGDLDVSTGIFSSPYPGSWTVTWSLHASGDAGDSVVQIVLRKNGQNIDESLHYSWYYGSIGGVRDQGKNITQYYNNNYNYVMYYRRPYHHTPP
jgi:hypothetical protein